LTHCLFLLSCMHPPHPRWRGATPPTLASVGAWRGPPPRGHQHHPPPPPHPTPLRLFLRFQRTVCGVRLYIIFIYFTCDCRAVPWNVFFSSYFFFSFLRSLYLHGDFCFCFWNKNTRKTSTRDRQTLQYVYQVRSTRPFRSERRVT